MTLFYFLSNFLCFTIIFLAYSCSAGSGNPLSFSFEVTKSVFYLPCSGKYRVSQILSHRLQHVHDQSVGTGLENILFMIFRLRSGSVTLARLSTWFFTLHMNSDTKTRFPFRFGSDRSCTRLSCYLNSPRRLSLSKVGVTPDKDLSDGI